MRTSAHTAAVVRPLEQAEAVPAARPRRALVLVGSAKPAGTSSSEAMGRALLERMAAHGVEGRIAYAHTGGVENAGLLPVVDGCDLLVLATPLYFDALPSHVVEVLARVARHRAEQSSPSPLALAAVVNCGTPDARQADGAIAMCALAARDARMTWLGGLAFGQGHAFDGRSPEKVGTERPIVALDAAARALAFGEPVPNEAVALAARPLMPEATYALMGNVGWLVAARRNGALLRIGDRPMEP